jgi:hypothetical protein
VQGVGIAPAQHLPEPDAVALIAGLGHLHSRPAGERAARPLRQAAARRSGGWPG